MTETIGEWRWRITVTAAGAGLRPLLHSSTTCCGSFILRQSTSLSLSPPALGMGRARVVWEVGGYVGWSVIQRVPTMCMWDIPHSDIPARCLSRNY